MLLATLKEKGQITLPADIRKQIHAGKGDIFNCEVRDGQVIMTLQKIVPARKASAKGLDIEKYIGVAKGNFGSVKEIDARVRNERESWD